VSFPVSNQPAVLVVGDVVDDCVVHPLVPPTPDSDTPAEIVTSPGGSGANVACWLGWRGVPVRFAGRVGVQDVDRHRRVFAVYGVQARLAGDQERPTGQIVVLTGSDGRRSMYVNRGANVALGRADLPAQLLDGVSWVHVSGYSLFADLSRQAVLELLATATRRGIPWSVDPSSVAFLRTAGAGPFTRWTAGAAVCLPNLAEALALVGAEGSADSTVDAAREAAEQLSAHYPTVAVTCGAQGVVVVAAGTPALHRPAVTAPLVDSTGAGDAFTAGFLARWVRSSELVSAAEAGLATAALALGRMGGRPPAVGDLT
jgi:sugar/nucleoside kinase (ribokinase family)